MPSPRAGLALGIHFLAPCILFLFREASEVVEEIEEAHMALGV
jgi:hypothetical protein